MSKEREKLPIKERKMDFGISDKNDLPRYWYQGDPVLTHYFNAGMFMFPQGEAFFIQAVLRYKGDIQDEELLERVKKLAPSVDVILMTAYDDMPTVVEAMREGACDFLVKPLDLHDLRLVLSRV